MAIITSRTCLWLLAATLTITFALSIGLTFRSNHHCFAATCGESLFPLQARLHVVVWYSWLVISITFLTIRSFHPSLQKILQTPMFERKFPLLGEQLAWGGASVIFWILLLYGIVTGIWWIQLRDYFNHRGHEGGVYSGNGLLAATALTGHLCDVTMGMTLLPLSRHSSLASFFKVPVATTHTLHIFTAYTLFALVLLHGLLYVAWIPIFHGLSDTLRQVYPILNPKYHFDETWPGDKSSLGIWRASLLFSGIVSGVIMLLISVTSLPALRNRHFNIFYFTHLLSIVAVAVVCLHASTMLYCTAPGLALWVLDWLMRLYELWAPLDGKITALGNGWYSTANEEKKFIGISPPTTPRWLWILFPTCTFLSSQLRHFNERVASFHHTTHLASQNTITSPKEDRITIQFLFRKRGVDVLPNTTKQPRTRSEWTNRLASIAAEESGNPTTDLNLTPKQIPSQDSLASAMESQVHIEDIVSSVDRATLKDVPLKLRLEGPYFAPAKPARYKTVVCLVAGTGISGALAIVECFRELERQGSSGVAVDGDLGCSSVMEEITQPGGGSGSFNVERNELKVSSKQKPRVWNRCVVVWSVREEQAISLKGLDTSVTSGLEVKIYLTGKTRPRLDLAECLEEVLPDSTIDLEKVEGGKAETWVYISGPDKFIAAGEKTCQEKRASGLAIDWYGAKWHV